MPEEEIKEVFVEDIVPIDLEEEESEEAPPSKRRTSRRTPKKSWKSANSAKVDNRKAYFCPVCLETLQKTISFPVHLTRDHYLKELREKYPPRSLEKTRVGNANMFVCPECGVAMRHGHLMEYLGARHGKVEEFLPDERARAAYRGSKKRGAASAGRDPWSSASGRPLPSRSSPGPSAGNDGGLWSALTAERARAPCPSE